MYNKSRKENKGRDMRSMRRMKKQEEQFLSGFSSGLDELFDILEDQKMGIEPDKRKKQRAR